MPTPADDEHLGPGPDAAAPERVQLPHARMPEHRAEQVLNIVRVQPGLRGLGAAGGDEVLLAGGVEGREFVLLFDLDDFLDDAAALGQQFHHLLVDAVDLDAQVVEAGFGGGGAEPASGLDWSSGIG